MKKIHTSNTYYAMKKNGTLTTFQSHHHLQDALDVGPEFRLNFKSFSAAAVFVMINSVLH